tara:strand:+ start:66161 stop:66532 length:372 start_codon:yes stop_codon:yes gene_type:complete
MVHARSRSFLTALRWSTFYKFILHFEKVFSKTPKSYTINSIKFIYEFNQVLVKTFFNCYMIFKIQRKKLYEGLKPFETKKLVDAIFCRFFGSILRMTIKSLPLRGDESPNRFFGLSEGCTKCD